jgi:hypothetical protein
VPFTANTLISSCCSAAACVLSWEAAIVTVLLLNDRWRYMNGIAAEVPFTVLIWNTPDETRLDATRGRTAAKRRPMQLGAGLKQLKSRAWSTRPLSSINQHKNKTPSHIAGKDWAITASRTAAGITTPATANTPFSLQNASESKTHE